ncbi:MAG: YihY/virulence factor BrkB family protein, partial [Spirochaetaceae bacterium]
GLHRWLSRERLDAIIHFRERWAHRLRFVRIYYRHNGALLAKGIAFSLLFGSIPLLFLLVSLRSVIFFPEFRAIIDGQVLAFLPPDIRQEFLQMALGNADRISSLDFVTLGAFLLAVNTLFTDLGTGMATMLDSQIRNGALYRLIAIPLMAAFVLLVYAASVLTPVIAIMQGFFHMAPEFELMFSRFISIGIYTLILMGLYYLFSRHRLRILPTVVIAFISASAWQGLSMLSARLVVGFGSSFLILGAVASVMIALFYMRILAEIFLISSIMVRIYAIPQGIAEREATQDTAMLQERLWRYLSAGVGPVESDDDGTPGEGPL